MAAALNKVLLIGNLTRDVEVKYTPKGTAVAQLSLAVNETYVKDGEKQETVTFVDCDVWGRTAENCAQYLAKGRPVFIEGRLKLESWDDKQSGQKRSKLKVTADRVQFLGGKDDQREAGPGEEDQRPRRAAAETPSDPEPEDDNIPF